VTERLADPSGQALYKKLSYLGITGYVGDMIFSKAVRSYLKEVRTKREKDRELRPRVMDIVCRELCSLEWVDNCFCEHVEKMFTGADISQIEAFYSRYQRSGNKRTSFFLYFITYEL
jgi:hypothetical protein